MSPAMLPLNAALAQLEDTEQALAAQHAAVSMQLEATREAIAAMRKVVAPSSNGAAPRPPAAAVQKRPAPRSASPAAVLKAGIHGSQAAAARDAAVMGLIASGVRTSAQLRVRIPPPDTFTPKQHLQSIANALSRLKARRLVARDGTEWHLTAPGRKVAANGAKEVP